MCLDEARYESIERIAWYCARTHRGATPLLTIRDRHDAALDGLVEYLADHGWPDTDKPLFLKARAAVEAEAHNSMKDLLHGNFWCEAPGIADPIGESITDKIGAWQVAWSLTDHQWAVVWALTEAIRRGQTWHAAADSLGMSPGAYRMTLHVARKKARQLWVAPGETPRGHWARGGSWDDEQKNARMAGRLRNRTRQRIRKGQAA